LVKTGQHSDQT